MPNYQLAEFKAVSLQLAINILVTCEEW